MDAVKALTIKPAQWCEQVAAWLKLAVAGDTIEDLIEQHLAGAQLFAVWDGAVMVAAYMLRIDRTARGYEGVIVAAGGRADVPLLPACLPYIERQFKAAGCTSIRLHTQRRGLVALAEKHGFGESETVMTKRF